MTNLNDIHAQAAAIAKQWDQITAAFTQQLILAGKACNDLVAALGAYIAQQQAPTPTPSPPTPPSRVEAVRFGRFVHEVDSTFPLVEQGVQWAWHVLQGDEWHQEQRAGLMAFPGGTVLRAATPVARRWGDEPGDSTCLPPGKIPDEWMMRDTGGKFITRPRDSDQFVDIGNPKYQAAVIDYLPPRLADEGWTGVWIDEVNPDPRSSFKNGDRLPAGYTSAYRYQVAIRGFVNAVTPAFHKAGLKVWINLSGDYDDAWTNGLAGETDGATIEFFVARDPHETGTLANGYFGEALGWVVRREAEGKPGMYNAQTTDPDLARYALGVFLLGWRGHGFFGAGQDPYPVSRTVWTPDMVNAMRLGSPVGEYRVDGGLYVRDFAHGRVTVNPSSAKLGGLAPMSAVIKLAV